MSLHGALESKQGFWSIRFDLERGMALEFPYECPVARPREEAPYLSRFSIFPSRTTCPMAIQTKGAFDLAKSGQRKWICDIMPWGYSQGGCN